MVNANHKDISDQCIYVPVVDVEIAHEMEGNDFEAILDRLRYWGKTEKELFAEHRCLNEKYTSIKDGTCSECNYELNRVDDFDIKHIWLYCPCCGRKINNIGGFLKTW